MMLKDGKLFGKVSIVDIAVLLIIILSVVGVYIRFFGKGSKAVAANSTFYATVKVQNIRESNVRALEKSLNLDFVTDEKVSSEFGKLIKMEKLDAVGVIEKSNGEVVNAPMPDRYDVYLTFEFHGKINDKGYYNGALREIGAGSTYYVRSKWTSIFGVVEKVFTEK